ISVDGRSCSSKQHGSGLDQRMCIGVLEKAFASRWLISSMLMLGAKDGSYSAQRVFFLKRTADLQEPVC
ncbi:hypothetical protein, partial [Mesotoga sp.]|uniref:hypothetical protein n=1 Tax=Mesotoga sp. TaxID=2053577 RepID=UPI00345E9262